MSEAKFGEPWKVNLVGSIYSQDGQRIWGVDEGPKDEMIFRAIECVNSLAGIADPEAWVKAHRELVTVSKWMIAEAEGSVGIVNPHPKLQRAIAACEAAEGRKG